MAFVRFLKPSLYFPDLAADCKEELIEELLETEYQARAETDPD